MDDLLMERVALYSEPAANGCVIWRGMTVTRGYPVVSLKFKIYSVRRLVLGWKGGALAPNQVVLASCGNRLCVNPDHLSAGSHADAYHRSGNAERIVMRGQKNGQSKLNPESVRSIRRLRAEGVSSGLLAATLGVSVAAIHKVEKRETWAHVE